MAVCNVVASGNASALGTWDVVPTSADTFVLPAGLTLTIDQDITFAGGTVESLTDGGLINNAKLTMTGDLNLGNGSAKDGCLTFGPGSELELVSADVVMNNCRLRNTSTTSNWAKVTGVGSFLRGAVHTYPKQDVVLQYVAFTATGAWYMSIDPTSGVAELTSQCDCSNLTIVNATNITMGRANVTSASATLKLNDSDIRDYTGTLTLSGTDKSTGAREFLRNTVSISTGISLRGTRVIGAGWDLTGTVFDRAHTKASELGASTRPVLQSGIFIGSGVAADNFTNGWGWQAYDGSTLEDSYIYVPPGADNAHAGGTITDGDIDSCVFEVYGSEPNIATSGTTALNGVADVINNVCIGTGAFVNQVGNNAGSGTLNVLHNTVFSTGGTGVHKGLFLAENGNFSGTLNLKSNISAVKSDTTLNYSVWDNDATPQPINSDYNCFHNFAVSPYYGVDITGAENDTTVNPQFVDETRCLTKWGAEIGVAETYDAVVGELLRRNGYDPATMTQSATPSGVTPADLVEWVRAGFAPTNAALLNAGHDGVTIGAMEYVSADDTAPVLTDATATATGPTTATASVTTDDGNGTLYFLASPNATESAATVKAALSQSVTTDGEQSVNLSALDPETTYYVHFVQINGASLESASVVSTAEFTTDAIPVKGATITLHAGTTPQASITDIVALWWDVTTPSGAPTYSTTTASTDASGVLTLDLDANTALAIGASGFLLLYKPDATDHRDSLVFAGRVAVSDIA